MVRSLLVRALAALVFVVSFVLPARARAEYRAAYPYRDAEFLLPGETGGGMVVVPDEIARGEKAPLVIILHGVNPDPVLHMWFGAKQYPDLSLLTEQMAAAHASIPFIFAGPSQTKNAMSGRTMWQDFDLDDFVRATSLALGGRAEIDRDAVYVIGHSGAGCNPLGGLLRVARWPSRIVPRGILAIDTCIDEDSGPALGSAPESTFVLVRWQSEIWPRPLDKFRATFKASADAAGHTDAITQCVNGLGEPVHINILVDAFTNALPIILARRGVPAPGGPPCPVQTGLAATSTLAQPAPPGSPR